MVRQVNFSNEAQNRAAGTISAAMYERKALDCTAPLPLIFSLNNLAYLVANNRKIRDLLCVDGGLERLIHILRDVPKNHTSFGRPRSPRDLQPMWKWTTAFQCIVHLCIRGGVNVRERAVEAGILPILVKVLESYLCFSDAVRTERKRAAEERRRSELQQGAGTAEGSSADVNALSRERRSARDRDRERRDREPAPPTARRSTITQATLPQFEQQSRRGASSSRHAVAEGAPQAQSVRGSRQASPSGSLMPPPFHLQADPSQRQYDSAAGNIRGESSATPMSIPVPIHRSLDARAALSSDAALLGAAPSREALHGSDPAGAIPPPLASSSASVLSSSSSSASSQRHDNTAAARGNGMLANMTSTEDLRAGEASGFGSGSEEGVEEAEMSGDCADPEDSEAEPSVVETSSVQSENNMEEEADERRTPRAMRRALVPLATSQGSASNEGRTVGEETPHAPVMSSRSDTVTPRDSASSRGDHASSRHHGRDCPGPSSSRTRPVLPTTYIAETFDPTDMAFREEEVLASLQILAYLTKYSHIRALLRFPEMTRASNLYDLDVLWEKAQTSPGTPMWQPGQQFHRSIYTIAERYTCRATRRDPNAEYVAGMAKLASPIQHWAGVVMRNACRKDDREGDVHAGLRQCGNMLCGKWETEPREFAKCRRCKKAKFCSKVCQSTSWQIGHKYWCSSIAEDAENSRNRSHRSSQQEPQRAGADADVVMTADPQALERRGGPLDAGLDGVDDGGARVLPRTHQPHLDRVNDEGHGHGAPHAPARAEISQTDATHALGNADNPTSPALRRIPPRRPSGFSRNHAVPSRLVSEAASLAASDMSEDEADRSRHVVPSDGELSETNEGGVNAISRGPPPAPLRTDIAGRPLPPPVIAGSGLEFGGPPTFNADEGLGGGEDSFGGRLTPGVDEQFARADIDQVTWRGQTPTPDLHEDDPILRHQPQHLFSQANAGPGQRPTQTDDVDDLQDDLSRTPMSSSIPLVGSVDELIEDSMGGESAGPLVRRFPAGMRLDAQRSVSSARPRTSNALLPESYLSVGSLSNRRAASGVLAAPASARSMRGVEGYEGPVAGPSGGGSSSAYGTLQHRQSAGENLGQSHELYHHPHLHRHGQQSQLHPNSLSSRAASLASMMGRSATPNSFGGEIAATPTVGHSRNPFGRLPPGDTFVASAMSSPSGSHRGGIEPASESSYVDDQPTPQVERDGIAFHRSYGASAPLHQDLSTTMPNALAIGDLPALPAFQRDVEMLHPTGRDSWTQQTRDGDIDDEMDTV